MAKMKVPGGRMVGALPEKVTEKAPEKRTRKAKETAETEKSAE